MTNTAAHPHLEDRILDLIILSSSLLGSVGEMTYHRYPYIYSAAGPTPSARNQERFQSAIKNLKSKKFIVETEPGVFQPTVRGAELRRAFIVARTQRWDGLWRVVIFDIPEKNRKMRDGFRAELRRLGFGVWQKSVWVTPFDVADLLYEYLQKRGIGEYAQVLVGKRTGFVGDKEFAAEVWPLDKLNIAYLALINDWQTALRQEHSNERRLQVAKDLHRAFVDLSFSDPHLPRELLPTDWSGDRANELFKKLRAHIALTQG